MTATFTIFVDESGDEGFSFSKGSPDWLVLSAVIVRRADELTTVKLVDDVRRRLGKPDKKPLHFRDLKHEQKIPFLDEIAKADLKTATVLIYKPLIKEPEKFRERYRLYFYATRLLLERASWYCRDHRTNQDAGDGSAEIVFSNRSSMSYDEMKEYFERLNLQSKLSDVRIDWSVIKPDQIVAYTSGRRMGLQIADAVASSFFSAAQPSPYGYTEDRYARMLQPTVYRYRKAYRGYGLKFWPTETDELIDREERFGWVGDFYK